LSRKAQLDAGVLRRMESASGAHHGTAVAPRVATVAPGRRAKRFLHGEAALMSRLRGVARLGTRMAQQKVEIVRLM
jgi:hypothetical protein